MVLVFQSFELSLGFDVRQCIHQLREFFVPLVAQLPILDQAIAFVFHPGCESLLALERLLPHVLEVFLRLSVHIEPVGEWNPLGPLYEFLSRTFAPLLVGDDPLVDVDVVDPERAVLWDLVGVEVVRM